MLYFQVVMFILGFFTSILLNVVDTIFMCFMIDKSKGIVTKPQLHEIMSANHITPSLPFCKMAPTIVI